MQPGISRTEEGHWQFTVWAPFADRVELVLPNSSEQFDMEKGKKGYWTKTIASVTSDTVYWYRLNGDIQRADPASAYQPDGVDGPSQVVDHSGFSWTDSGYQQVALEDYIIYEVHIGTFTPEGTFDAAAERLQTLKEMGITAVEVMPVAQFPGGRNWGYDGVFPYAVQNSYGGSDAFKNLINAAHQLGLAVILDVVYNHVGPEGNFLRDFGPYFTDHYNTPWGEAINFDQAYSDHVRNFFIENALYWFREYHLDALRLDALHAVFDISAKHFIRELSERVQALSKQLNRSLYLIGESDLNDVRLITPLQEAGYGLDAQWSDDFHHSVHALLTGEDFGYYQDFGSLTHLCKALQEGFVYDWKYSKFRKRKYGSSSRLQPACRFVVCTQNHDQVGNRMKGERLSQLIGFEGLKLAAGCLLLSPYIPLLFMGDEYGEDNPFLYFVSMNDANLVEAIRQGRAEEFRGFQWQGDCPDPQAEVTLEQSKLQWDKRRKEHHHKLLEFYTQLIKLRKEQVHFVSKENFSADIMESREILYWQRNWDTKRWLCLMNFSDQMQDFLCPAVIGRCQKILDSADTRWGGPAASMPTELIDTQNVKMPPHSLCLYEEKIQPV